MSTKEKLSIGFYRADISPDENLVLPITSISSTSGNHDPLTAGAIAADDGKTRVLIISLDLKGINQPICNYLKRKISEKTNVSEDNILLLCSHTHSVPNVDQLKEDNPYRVFLTETLADAGLKALADLSPAHLSIGRSEAKGIAFCRRYLMKDGTYKTNPGIGNENVEAPASPADESVQFIVVDREAKKRLIFVNFQCHADVVGGTLVSADFPHYMREKLESELDVTSVYFQGAAGNINHHDVIGKTSGRGHEHGKKMGYTIAEAVLRKINEIKPVNSEGVNCIHEMLTVNINHSRDHLVDEAKEVIQIFRNDKEKYKIISKKMDRFAASSIIQCAAMPETYDVTLTAIKLGGVAFMGISGEAFVETGVNIKNASDFDMTFICENANGRDIYIPTAISYEQGAYEVGASKFACGTAEKIEEKCIEMLKKL